MTQDETDEVCSPFWLAGYGRDNPFDPEISASLSAAWPRLTPRKDINDRWRRRFRSGLQCLLPSIVSALGVQSLDQLRQLTALEVGCGDGAKSLALAPFFKTYTGVDLSGSQIARASHLAKDLGIGNADFRELEAEAIPDLLAKTSFDVFILYAVVEHLTIDERLNLLSRIWRAMRPDSVLIVAELPNRLCPIDHHSSMLPYYDGLPPELALLYGKKSTRPDYKKRLYESEDPEKELYRIGRGASFHEFELSIGDLSTLQGAIAGDAWSPAALNQFPVRPYEITLLREFPSVQRQAKFPVIPPGFSRYYLELALKKSGTMPLRRPVVMRGLPEIRPGLRRLDVPEGAMQVSIGWAKPSLDEADAPVEVRDAKGGLVFEANTGEITRALQTPESSQVFTTFTVDAGAALRVSVPSGVEIACVVCR